VAVEHPNLTVIYPVEFVWRTGDDNAVLAHFVSALHEGLAPQ
jgi:hypothetical protein